MGMMNKEFNIEVGTSIISTYQRIDIESYRIFSEFIDNSFQSFKDHKSELENLGIKKCTIRIRWSPDIVTIEDDAYGMDEDAFGRALRLHAPASHYQHGSLSKYGMGLKYAACNLGDEYEIDTSQYGSNYKYSATVDVNDWIQRNPKTLNAQVYDDFNKDRHYTLISIRGIVKKPTEREVKEVIKKLGVIYGHFIDKGEISISINDCKVNYQEPELFEDENGKEISNHFERNFYYDGKKYSYYGWIGELKKGSTSDAGLTLFQNERGIELNFKPKEIFGAGNDFRQQRVVGEIHFEGDNWEVRINKDGLAWNNNGLKEKFIENLGSSTDVKEVLKFAKENRVRKSDKYKVKPTATGCNIHGIRGEYTLGEKVCFSVIPQEGYHIKNVKVDGREILPETEENGIAKYSFNITEAYGNIIKLAISSSETTRLHDGNDPLTINGSNSATGRVDVNLMSENGDDKIEDEKNQIEVLFSKLKELRIPGECVKENPNLDPSSDFVIEYKNTKYGFKVADVTGTSNADFIEIHRSTPNFENSFTLRINFQAGFLEDMFMTTEMKKILMNLVTTIALSVITAESSGLSFDNSKILLNKLNEIFGKTAK